MNIQDEINLNKYGQEILSIEELEQDFLLLDDSFKKKYLTTLAYLIMQSKPEEKDIQISITNSNLRTTYTPCVMLIKGGIGTSNLIKIIELPVNEYQKIFKLFVNLFKCAYQRRYIIEKNNPTKWWYWDLSVKANILKIQGK